MRDDVLELYPSVDQKGYFRLHFQGRVLHLSAGAYIGLIPISPRITIDVQPKLRVSNLTRVIELSQERLQFIDALTRFYDHSLEATGSILEFLVHGLLASIAEIDARGLHREYTSAELNSSSPRGRINLRATFTRNQSRGIDHKVICERFEASTDTPYNRVIKAALWTAAQRITRLQGHSHALAGALNVALRQYERIPFDTSVRTWQRVDELVRDGRVPPAREYYVKPLQIALTILAGKGISLSSSTDDVALSSYIVNFDLVFEAYVRQVLQLSLSSDHPELLIQDGNNAGKRPLYVDRKEPLAQPDIVISREGICELVADVKYKDKPDRENVNQVVTYAACYGAKRALLIVQGDSNASCIRVGRIGKLDIFSYSFDLGAVNLEAEEQRFAQAVSNLVA